MNEPLVDRCTRELTDPELKMTVEESREECKDWKLSEIGEGLQYGVLLKLALTVLNKTREKADKIGWSTVSGNVLSFSAAYDLAAGRVEGRSWPG